MDYRQWIVVRRISCFAAGRNVEEQSPVVCRWSLGIRRCFEWTASRDRQKNVFPNDQRRTTND
jgi:hypothetical protein